jgi:hypothetical protein
VAGRRNAGTLSRRRDEDDRSSSACESRDVRAIRAGAGVGRLRFRLIRFTRS